MGVGRSRAAEGGDRVGEERGAGVGRGRGKEERSFEAVKCQERDWRTSAERWETSDMPRLKDLLSLLGKYQSSRRQANVFQRMTSLLWGTNVLVLITHAFTDVQQPV